MTGDDSITRPTLETILERINALGMELRTEMASLCTGMESLRTGMDAMRAELLGEIQRLSGELDDFRKETQENFRQVNRKLQILAGEQLDYRASLQRLEDRVERLERNAD